MNRGSRSFISPEVFSTTSYSYEIDVFSFSIVQFCILFNVADPYFWTKQLSENANDDFFDFKIDEKVSKGMRPMYPPGFKPNKQNEWFCKLMCQSWHQDKNARPSFSDIEEVFKKNYS